MVPKNIGWPGLSARVARANYSSRSQVRQHLHQFKFWGDPNRRFGTVNAYEQFIYEFSAGYTGVHGARALRGALRLSGGYLCVWHVHARDDNIGFALQRVPGPGPNLPQSNRRRASSGLVED